MKLKKANAWGLYDMLGNVWEWVDDPYLMKDGAVAGEAEAARRVLRGGSWNNLAQHIRSAFRGAIAPDERYDFIGFRCARVQA